MTQFMSQLLRIALNMCQGFKDFPQLAPILGGEVRYIQVCFTLQDNYICTNLILPFPIASC